MSMLRRRGEQLASLHRAGPSVPLLCCNQSASDQVRPLVLCLLAKGSRMKHSTRQCRQLYGSCWPGDWMMTVRQRAAYITACCRSVHRVQRHFRHLHSSCCRWTGMHRCISATEGVFLEAPVSGDTFFCDRYRVSDGGSKARRGAQAVLPRACLEEDGNLSPEFDAA